MYTTTQLKRATAIAEQIEKLQAELAALLGSPAKVSTASPVAVAAPAKGKRGGKRFVSAEARAKMAAAQKARWAAKNAGQPAKAPAKAKTGLTAEGRARLAAAMKARWAARKKGGAAVNTPAKAAAPAQAAKPAKKAKKAKRNISPEARAKMAEAAKRRWANVKKS